MRDDDGLRMVSRSRVGAQQRVRAGHSDGCVARPLRHRWLCGLAISTCCDSVRRLVYFSNRADSTNLRNSSRREVTVSLGPVNFTK